MERETTEDHCRAFAFRRAQDAGTFIHRWESQELELLLNVTRQD
jgi:hypothetical protein